MWHTSTSISSSPFRWLIWSTVQALSGIDSRAALKETFPIDDDSAPSIAAGVKVRRGTLKSALEVAAVKGQRLRRCCYWAVGINEWRLFGVGIVFN